MLEQLLKEQSTSVTTKPEMEMVENEKEEYKLIGQYLRTRGLRLYSYNSIKNELLEVEIEKGDTLHLLPNENGKLHAVNLEMEKVVVDSRNEYFEALKMDTAKKRVNKWKAGKIKELCNLREPGNGINLY